MIVARKSAIRWILFLALVAGVTSVTAGSEGSLQPATGEAASQCAFFEFRADGPQRCWPENVPCPFWSWVAISPDCPHTFDWDFGDGTPHSTETNPVHTFINDTPYNKSFYWQVTFTAGATTRQTGAWVEIKKAADIRGDCVSQLPHQGYPPLTVHFYAFNSPHCPALLWNFGDGTTSTEANPVHSYSAPGDYAVTLKGTYWDDGLKRCYDFTYGSNEKLWTSVLKPCALDCAASAPLTARVGEEITITSSVVTDCYGDTQRTFDFGDGTTSESQAYHAYARAGTYHWVTTYKNLSWNLTCTKEGDIVVASCNLQCTASAPEQARVGDPFPFASSVTPNDCTGPKSYDWDFGDGTAHSTLEQPSHTYAQTGVYTWKLTVKMGDATCTKTGTISVGCIVIGSLRLCADQIQKSRESNLYTFTGHPHINDLLFFGGVMTFEGDPESGTGMLRTSGAITVDNGPVAETLYQGSDLAFEVGGGEGTLTPRVVPGNFSCKLAGLALSSNGPITVGEESVTIRPIFYVGLFGLLTLASIQATVEYPEDEYKKVLGFELVSGQGTPSIQVLQIKGSYDPQTDILSGTLGVDFPFMEGAPEFEATLRMWHECINGFDFSAGLGIPFAPPYAELSHITVKVDNICRPSSFNIFFGGNLTFMEIPEEFLLLKDLGLKYSYPFLWRIQGGTATFLGYEIGSVSGTIGYKPGHYGFTFQWNVDLANVYRSSMNVALIPSRPIFLLTADGTLTVPDLQCGMLNVPCRILRRAVRAAVPVPYEIEGAHMDGTILKTPGGDFTGHLRGKTSLGPLNAVFQIEIRNTNLSVLLGSNFQDLIEIGARAETPASPLASEQTVNVPAGLPVVLFGATSDTALPAITLKNPSGQTITPANASTFPGVTYLPGEGENLALFQVLNPAAGAWVLGQSNLQPSQVTLCAISPAPEPVTTFTSVQRQGNSVSIAASVTPARAETKVSFLFTRNPSGIEAEWIAGDLAATSGSVGATWDLSGLDSGTYYLLARTDDGMNPAATALYPQPIVIDRGLVAPPTNLKGTRAGTTATIRWTPSATAGAGTYQILYTGDPEKPGYPRSESTALPSEALIEDLNPDRTYRFCAVAFDAQGNASVESAPLTLEPGSGIPGDCDGGGTVSIGEVQKAINMFLGSAPPDCGVDCNGDGTVSIGEVQKVINGFLGVAASC
jgi:PKD repeat protein